MEGMIRRLLDWGGYAGLTVLVVAAILPFLRPEWMRFRWALVAAGVLLVLASLLARIDDFRGLVGRRTGRYRVNSAGGVALLLGAPGAVQARSLPPNARLGLTENH